MRAYRACRQASGRSFSELLALITPATPGENTAMVAYDINDHPVGTVSAAPRSAKAPRKPRTRAIGQGNRQVARRA
jgi:hypothetical protein